MKGSEFSFIKCLGEQKYGYGLYGVCEIYRGKVHILGQFSLSNAECLIFLEMILACIMCGLTPETFKKFKTLNNFSTLLLHYSINLLKMIYYSLYFQKLLVDHKSIFLGLLHMEFF